MPENSLSVRTSDPTRSGDLGREAVDAIIHRNAHATCRQRPLSSHFGQRRRHSIMSIVRSCELPTDSFLLGCRKDGGYTDCYAAEMVGSISQAAFIEAFYTTALFKVERTILRWLAARPSTDGEAKQLADGTTASFAAWRVERRSADQLLLADVTGRTRSWLMAAPVNPSTDRARTRLYFGSGVGPRPGGSGGGKSNMGAAYHALLGFHKLYSRLLLGAAHARLSAGRAAKAA